MSAVTASLWLCVSTGAHADIIELHNGDQLTGNIQSLDNTLITLQSALSLTPLKIKAEAVRKITFPDTPKENQTHTEQLTLTNHDVIPCKVLSIDEKKLHVSTWYAGNFSIPRPHIQTLQFGIFEEKTIYTGNDAPSQWSTHDGQWSQSKNSYSCRSKGTLARKLDLPENVRFNFDLSWKGNPNFAFRFCAETNAATTKQDTYELVFNSAGMQIRRFENSTQPAAPLANIPIKPFSYDGAKLNIDLRVNRADGLITLYIDKKFHGTWHDTFNPSKGNHIILNNRGNSSSRCTITDFRVIQMNHSAIPRHRENALLSKEDVLIDSEGEKISGDIIHLNGKTPDKRTLVFNANHSSSPIRVPDHRISTLLFAQPENVQEFPLPHFTAKLKNNGSIQLKQIKFVQGGISCQHPILGPCKINIHALHRIQRSSAKPEVTKTQ
ncbi:MAG: hypothetical protein KJO21_08650 [Verrucomicrobiae bacterium]|nr:hypothetical protein [Verrucomicrobiae bacterium]NNJ42406.1 hypothetical protein [Akkermansiaceae bacterium]